MVVGNEVLNPMFFKFIGRAHSLTYSTAVSRDFMVTWA